MIKELFNIEDSLANKISYYHLMLFLLSLPFDRFYSHLILISFSIHTIIQFNKNDIKPVFTWRTMALQSVFLVTLVSAIYTADPQGASREWELNIPILLFPLLFCFNSLDLRKYRPQLLLAFSLGCTATILYLYFDAFATIGYYKLPLSAIFSHTFTNHNFSEPIDMHATFFSLQVVIALVYLLSRGIKESSTLNRVVFGLCSLILVAGMIQLSSKSAVVALLLIVNVALPYFILQGIRRKRFVTITSTLSLLLIAVVLSSTAFKTRYLGELKNDLSLSKAGETTDPRMARWGVAAELIRQSPLIGYGAGSEIELLRERYFAKKFYRSYLNHLNAHNEYLSFLLKSGIWGLAVYLATLAYGFKKAARKKDIVFFSFMMLLAVVSLSENILDADKGVMFYSFFFAFFIFSSYEKEKLQIPIKKHKYLRKVATNHVAVTSSL
jgi:O-antigen ligase